MIFEVNSYVGTGLKLAIRISLHSTHYRGSMAKVVENINGGYGTEMIDYTFVSNFLQSKPQLQLHKILNPTENPSI
jgi:hypothetical protein